MCSDISRNLQPPIFAKKWMGGVCIISGIFILDGVGLTPRQATNDLHSLYEAIRLQRACKWPRGIAWYVLIPVYCAPSFETAARDFLFGYNRPHRFYISMMPVLYNSINNRTEAKDAVQNNTLMYYKYLRTLFAQGIVKAVEHFDHRPELTTDAYDEIVAKLLAARGVQSRR
jgi:hypothetical protein